MNRKRRYRQYLEPNSTATIPRRTQYRLRKRAEEINRQRNRPNSPAQELLPAAAVPLAQEVNENNNEVHDGGAFIGNQELGQDNQNALRHENTDSSDSGTSSSSPSTPSSNSSASSDVPEPSESSSSESEGNSTSRESEHASYESSNISDSDESDDAVNDDYRHIDFNAEGINGFKIFEILLMTLAFCMRHCLSFEALKDVLKLLATITGIRNLPTSKYLIKKLFDAKENLIYHFVCQTCKGHVGSYSTYNAETMRLNVECLHCHTQNNLKKCNMFITMPLVPQLRKILSDNEIADAVLNRFENQAHDGSINDICDGTMYKKLAQDINMQPQDLTTTFNSDGISAFKSNFSSIWAILLTLNELPAKLRNSNILVTGVWFGSGEPCMQTFFKPMANEFEKLQNGFKWMRGVTEVTSRVFAICCCVDSKARNQMMTMSQFNAKYGCPWCYHPGTLIRTATNKTGALKYSMVSGEYELRTDAELRADMLQAANANNAHIGVKGISVFTLLPKFDLCQGFVVDYMHCVLIGVIKALANLWFERSAIPNYYIGTPNQLHTLDRRMLNLKINRTMHRRPRKISDHRHWKASEWKNFLLFFALPVLSGILPVEYLNHLTFLIGSIHVLLKEKIHQDDLEFAEGSLLQFVTDYENLYGEENMTFNVHQLTHLVQSVRCYGPLWAHSCFPFEGFNAILLNQVHGANGVIHQIVNRFKIRDAVLKISSLRRAELKQETKFYLKNLQQYMCHPIMNTTTGDRKSHMSDALANAVKLLEYKNAFPCINNCYTKGMVYDTFIVGTDSSSFAARNDSFIKFNDTTALEILSLSDCIDTENAMFIGYKWTLSQVFENTPHIHKLTNRQDNLTMVRVNRKFEKMLYMECNNVIYGAILPNTIEKE